MPCSCHAAGEEMKKYHETRGYCDDSKRSNYKSGLAEMVNSYESSTNKGNYK